MIGSVVWICKGDRQTCRQTDRQTDTSSFLYIDSLISSYFNPFTHSDLIPHSNYHYKAIPTIPTHPSIPTHPHFSNTPSHRSGLRSSRAAAVTVASSLCTGCRSACRTPWMCGAVTPRWAWPRGWGAPPPGTPRCCRPSGRWAPCPSARPTCHRPCWGV